MTEKRDNYRAGFVAACLHGQSARVRALYGDVRDGLNAIRAGARDVDASGAYPSAAFAALGDAGAPAATVPERCGGLGASDAIAGLLVETVARACPSTAAILMFHYQVVRRSAVFGAENPLLERDLRAVAGEGTTGVSGWTEPGARSDKSATRTRAELVAAGTLHVDGLKSHVTGLRAGAVAHVLCKVGGDDPGSLSFVRVALAPGAAAIGELYALHGLRGSATGSLVLAGVEVPAHSVVGRVGAGSALMRANHHVLLNPGLVALGIASAALEHVLDVLLAREADGDAAGGERARRVTAECEIELRAAYALAAELIANAGDDAANLRFKVFASRIAARAVGALAGVSGSAAFHAGTPLERALRDVRAAALMGPTNDAIVTRIGRELAGAHPSLGVAAPGART